MLTSGRAPVAPRPPTTRWRAVGAALVPTARVSHLGMAGLTVALGAIPLVVTVARGDSVSTPIIIVGLMSGATLGWAVDEPAADLLAAMPVSSPVRATLRVLFGAIVAAIGVAVSVVLLVVGPGLPSDRNDRLPEAAAAAALALSVGFLTARHGERGAGPIGVTAGVLGTAFMASLAFRWPNLLPTFEAGPTHDRWWILVFAGLLVVATVGRDPGRRGRRLRLSRSQSCVDIVSTDVVSRLGEEPDA